MQFATTKELRLRTKEILERVKGGQRFAITYRGKPVALILPFEEYQSGLSVRPYDEAWTDIVHTLETTEPHYADWREALRESRRGQ